MDEEPLMDLHPEVQQCSSACVGNVDTRPSRLVSVIQHRLQQWQQMNGGGGRKTRVERKTDRKKDAVLKLIVDIRRLDQRWATV